jgi:hypothetical protein
MRPGSSIKSHVDFNHRSKPRQGHTRSSVGARSLFDVTECLKNTNTPSFRNRRPCSELTALVRKRQRECLLLRQSGKRLDQDDSYADAYLVQASVSEL